MAEDAVPPSAEKVAAAAESEQPEIKFVPATGFPPAAFPVIYADGIANVSPSRYTAKMYLLRTDSEITGKSEYHNQVIAQLVMPLDGFINMTIFLNNVLDDLLAKQVISTELIEEIKSNMRKT